MPTSRQEKDLNVIHTLGVGNSIMETAERLYMLQDYCQTNAFKGKTSTGCE